MILYKTLKNDARAEQVIDKSKFIAHIKYVTSKEEADEFIKEIKKEHRNATHNVPAMVIGDKFQIQWASDDGEPQGTSGAPIVSMLVKEGITNVAVVVTRYFGGVKLGTGGLVRAYTSSAKLALETGGIAQVKEMAKSLFKIEYSHLQIIQNLIKERTFEVGNINYGEKIEIEFFSESEEVLEVEKFIAETTNGRGEKLRSSIDIVKV